MSNKGEYLLEGDQIDIRELIDPDDSKRRASIPGNEKSTMPKSSVDNKATGATIHDDCASYYDRFMTVEEYKREMVSLIGEEAIDPMILTDIAQRELLAQRSHYNGSRPSLRRRGYISNLVYSKTQRPTTEAGNAERMADLFAGELFFCHEIGRWYEWTGIGWNACDRGEMTRHCIAMIKTILVEARFASNRDREKELLKHYDNSQTKRSIDAAIDLARDLDAFTVPLADLDQDPALLACISGTIDLRTGNLMRHNPEHLITRVVKVEYDRTADCPLWMKFLDTVFGGNKEVIEYVQTLIGYAATGEVREHKLVMLYGTGANGKSTFLMVLQQIMGDYAKQSPPDLLVARRGGGGHPCDVADLVGARFIVDSEVGQFATFDAAKIKRLTGGDKIKARHLYRSFFEFQPEFKLFIAMNDKPKLPGDDEGIWRRVDLLPFEVQIPLDQRDVHLSKKLMAEAKGILRWIVEGAAKWYEHGLQPPKEVSYATEAYRAENDPIGEFLKQECRIVIGAKTRSTELYEEYTDWCESQGTEPVKQNRFSRSLTKRKFKKEKNGQGLMVYCDIEIGSNCCNQSMAAIPEGPIAPCGETDASADIPNFPTETSTEMGTISRWLRDNAFYDPDFSTDINDLWRLIQRDDSGFSGKYTKQQGLIDELQAAGWPVSDQLIYDQLDHIVLHDKNGRVDKGIARPLAEIYSISLADDYAIPMDIYDSELPEHL